MSNTPLILRKPVVPVSFGIEIEGRNPNLRNNFLYQHLSFFFINTDGSLEYRDSVEVVSQPLPPKMLLRCLQNFKKKYGEITPEYSAGIHIHITRTKKTQQRLENFYKFLYENRDYNFLFFFGRTENYYARWNVPLEEAIGTRYSAVNFRNRNTIEIRAFGNNNPYGNNGIDSALAYIQRTQAILDSKEEFSLGMLREIAKKFPIIST